jgi:hypothetical protein
MYEKLRTTHVCGQAIAGTGAILDKLNIEHLQTFWIAEMNATAHSGDNTQVAYCLGQLGY